LAYSFLVIKYETTKIITDTANVIKETIPTDQPSFPATQEIRCGIVAHISISKGKRLVCLFSSDFIHDKGKINPLIINGVDKKSE
jgi:S-ribosylhomocysteine lyase LuxS involved in autoinducer biosynthesis